MNSATWRSLSNICFAGGFISIAGSIVIWLVTKEPDPAYGERFGIFVGLWAPTFFALSSRLEQYATEKTIGG